MKTAVIGSGIGGLAIAARLAKRGYDVTLYEKNSTPGGKVSQIKERGYRFDTGPSLFTLPNLVDEIADIKYFKLDNSCRYFYPDGTKFNFYQDPEKLKEETIKNSSEDYANIEKRLKDSSDIYNLTSDLFIFNSFSKISNFLKPENRKIPLKLHKMGFHRSMHSANKALFKDRHIVQLFDRYATYNGSSPYRAPATLNMISHLEHNIGAFFPENGIYAIVESLYKKGVELGVKYLFNTPVSSIIIDKKSHTAKGLVVNNQELFYDIVVSDCDVKYLSENMMPCNIRHPLGNRLKQLEPSSSALIFYWGVKGEHPQLDVHNILFSDNYKKEFDSLFYKMNLYKDPTIYIFISKKAVPADAPQGCENWFVMVNAPANIGQDWHSIITKTRGEIIKKINHTLGADSTFDIEKQIEFEHIASPVTIEKNTLSSRGALYGSSSNSIMAAFMRHPNFLRKFKNLYFVGGSVHPGGGIPLCLAGAKIVEREIIERDNWKGKE
ncbi:MAG: phytoene desaturase [Bacteroidetes bacterium HGW-Bacteroidetes-8]|jgi:phytoene desaturase|nr:MAG: phytoene desaturase [Bacteroidetes bacterium HGW-Bacteroidetes-8]